MVLFNFSQVGHDDVVERHHEEELVVKFGQKVQGFIRKA
jgi:hypothetical protein